MEKQITVKKLCLNFLEGREDKLEAGVAGNADGVAKNAEGVAKNAKGVAKNADGVADNADGVAKNADGVAKNAEGVAKNADGVADVATKQRLQKTQLDDHSTRLEFLESGMILFFSAQVYSFVGNVMSKYYG